MARPIKFPEVNVNWWGQGDVGDLPAYRDEEGSISCWHLGWRERIRLLLTGRVWLHVYGKQHPPVNVGAEDPFYDASAFGMIP